MTTTTIPELIKKGIAEHINSTDNASNFGGRSVTSTKSSNGDGKTNFTPHIFSFKISGYDQAIAGQGMHINDIVKMQEAFAIIRPQAKMIWNNWTIASTQMVYKCQCNCDDLVTCMRCAADTGQSAEDSR